MDSSTQPEAAVKLERLWCVILLRRPCRTVSPALNVVPSTWEQRSNAQIGSARGGSLLRDGAILRPWPSHRRPGVSSARPPDHGRCDCRCRAREGRGRGVQAQRLNARPRRRIQAHESLRKTLADDAAPTGFRRTTARPEKGNLRMLCRRTSLSLSTATDITLIFTPILTAAQDLS